MWRPVPEAHATVHEAINLIIPARFADRHKEIERQDDAEALERERDFAPSGDPMRDSLIKSGWRHSRQLEELVKGIMEDARRLLRQWLRDGKVQAFYSDPLFGGEVSIAPSAWGLSTTDQAIVGGDYHPYGNAKPGGPVGLLRSDLLKLTSIAVEPDSSANGDETSDPKAGSEQASSLPAATERHIVTNSEGATNRPSENTPAPLPSQENAARALTKPEGKDRKIAGVRIALRELALRSDVSAQDRGTAVQRWLKTQGWDAPKDIERSINRVLNPVKSK